MTSRRSICQHRRQNKPDNRATATAGSSVLEWSVGYGDSLTADCYRCAVDGGSNGRRYRVTCVAVSAAALRHLIAATAPGRRTSLAVHSEDAPGTFQAVHCEFTARLLLHLFHRSGLQRSRLPGYLTITACLHPSVCRHRHGEGIRLVWRRCR